MLNIGNYQCSKCVTLFIVITLSPWLNLCNCCKAVLCACVQVSKKRTVPYLLNFFVILGIKFWYPWFSIFVSSVFEPCHSETPLCDLLLMYREYGWEMYHMPSLACPWKICRDLGGKDCNLYRSHLCDWLHVSVNLIVNCTIKFCLTNFWINWKYFPQHQTISIYDSPKCMLLTTQYFTTGCWKDKK